MQLPARLRVELVASEPLNQDPSCIAFDGKGRLFVCELRGHIIEGHLDVVELNKTGVLDTKVRRIRWELMGGKVAEAAKKLQYGVVKLLTDTDGDGVMDKAEMWAKDLPPCYGIIPTRGGGIEVAAPDIVFPADQDGDGKADVRETLFTGFRGRVLERGINNPWWDWIIEFMWAQEAKVGPSAGDVLPNPLNSNILISVSSQMARRSNRSTAGWVPLD